MIVLCVRMCGKAHSATLLHSPAALWEWNSSGIQEAHIAHCVIFLPWTLPARTPLRRMLFPLVAQDTGIILVARLIPTLAVNAHHSGDGYRTYHLSTHTVRTTPPGSSGRGWCAIPPLDGSDCYGVGLTWCDTPPPFVPRLIARAAQHYAPAACHSPTLPDKLQ